MHSPNDETLRLATDAHFARLAQLSDGRVPDRPFWLAGITGKSTADKLNEPEQYVEESLASLVPLAGSVADPLVFRPLTVEFHLYGVHFVDDLLGCRVFRDEETGQWYNDYLDQPIGGLRLEEADDQSVRRQLTVSGCGPGRRFERCHYDIGALGRGKAPARRKGLPRAAPIP